MTAWHGNIDTATCVEGAAGRGGAGQGSGAGLQAGSGGGRQLNLRQLRRRGTLCELAQAPSPNSTTRHTLAGLLAVLESDRELNGRWYAWDGKEVPW